MAPGALQLPAKQSRGSFAELGEESTSMNKLTVVIAVLTPGVLYATVFARSHSGNSSPRQRQLPEYTISGDLVSIGEN